MRNPTFTRLLLMAITLFVASAAVGEPPGPRRHRRPQQILERNLDNLDLEAEQKERVTAILDAAKERRQAGRSELRTAFEQMQTLLETDPPDEAAIMRQANKIGDLKSEEHKAMLRTLLAVRAELTPEQREKLKTMSRRKGPPPWRKGTPGGEAGEEP